MKSKGMIATRILAEFERLKYCPEREQMRIINALIDNGTIEVVWHEDKDYLDIKIGSAFEVKNFKINRKLPLDKT